MIYIATFSLIYFICNLTRSGTIITNVSTKVTKCNLQIYTSMVFICK